MGYTPVVRWNLEALPRAILQRVDARLPGLVETPHPSGVERIHGIQEGLRVPVGDDWMLYTVDHAYSVMIIACVRHRRVA